MQLVENIPTLCYSSNIDLLQDFMKEVLLEENVKLKEACIELQGLHILLLSRLLPKECTDILIKIRTDSWSELLSRVEFWLYRNQQNTFYTLEVNPKEFKDSEVIILKDQNSQRIIFYSGSNLNPFS